MIFSFNFNFLVFAKFKQFGEILGILPEAATSNSLPEFESEIGSSGSEYEIDDSKSESQIQSSGFEFKSQFDFYLPYLLLPGNEVPK